MTQATPETFCGVCKHVSMAHVNNGKCMMPGCGCLHFSEGGPDGPEATVTTDGTTTTIINPATPAAAPLQKVEVPADCIVSPCKVSPGRFVPVIVPLRLTKSEAQRLVSFIMLLVDDEDACTLPTTSSASSD